MRQKIPHGLCNTISILIDVSYRVVGQQVDDIAELRSGSILIAQIISTQGGHKKNRKCYTSLIFNDLTPFHWVISVDTYFFPMQVFSPATLMTSSP